MAVRAKMTVTGIEDGTYVEGKRATFYAVYDSDPASPNHEWSKWTPWGKLELDITNPAAFDQFEIGKTYWVDIHPVEEG